MTKSPWIPAFLLIIISFPLIFFITSHFIKLPLSPYSSSPPSISLSDELDDLALFNRAVNSFHPTHLPKLRRTGSTNKNPKIAFLFLTNTQFHFAPLWEVFFKVDNVSGVSVFKDLFNVYVHADPNVRPEIKAQGFVFTKDRFIPAKETHRGSASLIAAARRLIANAILDDQQNMFFSLVSQHCVPLHSFKYFYDTLLEVGEYQVGQMIAVKFKSFIEVIDEDVNLWDRYNARGKNVMVPEVKFEDFRVGSQFFTLTRNHGLLVIRERRLWKKFRMPCVRQQSCYPEEHYFPTLLSMEDPDGCSGYTLTRVNWTDSVNGHPHTYHPNELSKELIYSLRKSEFKEDYMFARKFSPDCLGPLMDMADDVIFKD